MTTTTKSPTYQLVAEKAGVDTIEYLTARRDAGDSWRLISLQLLNRYGINVTEVTLRSWWDKAHPKETPEAAPEPAPATD